MARLVGRTQEGISKAEADDLYATDTELSDLDARVIALESSTEVADLDARVLAIESSTALADLEARVLALESV